MVRGALSDDHMIQLKVVTGTLNSQKYQDQILEFGVRSPMDSLDGQNMVLRDDIERPHLKILFLTFNILLESKFTISLCTDLIFTDHLFIC